MISIIIPSYNREKTIQKSILSILNQTFSDIEVIVIDDGSCDNTKNVVLSLNDTRIKYIYQQNSGACAARNNGILHATGEYIAFQDSDDVWKKDKLEKELNFLLNNNFDFVFSQLNRIYDNFSTIIPNWIEDQNDITLESVLAKNCCSTQTMLMTRKCARTVMFDNNLKKLQDWDFFIRVIKNGYKIGFISEPLVDCYIMNDSITNLVSTENAYCTLIQKYKDDYNTYKSSLAEMYMFLARFYRNNNRIKAEKYLLYSFKAKLSLKTLTKLIVNPLHLWNE